jgi:uncharacterized protein (TIGR03437 family)
MRQSQSIRFMLIKGLNLSKPGASRTWLSSDFINNQMPTALDGITVTVNNKSAFLEYISPTQINILTPPDAMPSTVPIQVANNGAVSAAMQIPAQPVSPSFFLLSGPYVAATHANGSFLGPTTLIPGVTTPAQPSEIVVLYGTGCGATTPPVVSGSASQSGTLSPLPVVTIGGIAAQVQFAGLARDHSHWKPMMII